MLRLYGRVAALALRRSAQSWLAALSIPVYGVLFVAAATIAAPLGPLGGFLLGFLGAAFCAGYLFVLSSAVTGNKIRWSDLKDGLRGIWDVISVLFAVMILGLGVWVLKGIAGPKAVAVAAIAQLAAAFFLNAVPELLYNSRNRSFQLLKESVDFVMVNPVAWFLPNIIFGLSLLAATGVLSFSGPPPPPAVVLMQLSQFASLSGVLGLLGSVPLWAVPLLVVFIHFVMVFRGLLFQELTSGSARQRDFRRRMAR